MSKFKYLIFLFSFSYSFSQNLTFLSEETKEKLPNVLVIDKKGNVITVSDKNGNIKKELLKDDYYTISYNNITDSLNVKDISGDFFIISDKITEIKPLLLSKKNTKHFFISGYFISYVLMNGEINSYSDGIISYKIDKIKNKSLNYYISQYRVFTLKPSKIKLRDTETFNLKAQMSVPELDVLQNLNDFIKNNNGQYKISKKDETIILEKDNRDAEINFWGYQMRNFSGTLKINYSSGHNYIDFPFNNIKYFERLRKYSLRHKKEESFNDIVIYTMFYPTNILDKKPENTVRFNKNKSYYINEFWKSPNFPIENNMIDNYDKSKLEEQRNSK